MAEKMVLWSNLERRLGGPEVESLLLPLKAEVAKLRDLVRRSQGAVLAIEDRDLTPGDLMHGWLVNHFALLSQADDLLDQILTSYQRARLCRGGFKNEKMARRVGKISENITRSIEMNELDNQPDHQRFQHIEWIRPAEHTITGRDDVKIRIINMLLQPPKHSRSNVSMIYMSGLRGVGKSALAREIYVDHRVKNHFDLKMWIPVSQITNETEIIRKIVETCTDRRSRHSVRSQSPRYLNLMGCQNLRVCARSPDTTVTLDETEIWKRRLRKEVRGKLYLLVLDDVCLQKWQSLPDLLARGAKGSRIFVTTRTAEVADSVKSESLELIPYPLPCLSEDHSLTLFKTLALKTDETCDAEMLNTGLEITKICKYIPLTIKFAARFLHGKTRDQWLTYIEGLRLRRERSEDIMDRALDLSYSDLPTYMRACFGYCSVFPVGFTFNKNDLISLWIAQGFVDSRDGQSLEEAGERYFMELLRRCFFEEVCIDESGNILTCQMHHIVWSWASTFLTRVSDPIFKYVSVNCREDFSLKLSSRRSRLLKSPTLQTLIFDKEIDCNKKVDRLVLYHMISIHKRLRVLDLHDLGLKELPHSIGDQLHLRYLDLSKNDVVSLPWSVTKLYNLQTLKLNSCRKLERLVNDFGLLVNLKRLEVNECDSLTSMPLGLEKLTQLEVLSRFVVGSRCSKWTYVDDLERVLSGVIPSVAPQLAVALVDTVNVGLKSLLYSEQPATVNVGLKALSGLTMLRGMLAIDFTGEWMTSISEAERVLCTKPNLVEVNIRWPRTFLPISGVEVSQEMKVLAYEEILMHLKPHPNLEVLRIYGYEGKVFPSWARFDMISCALPNLVTISVEGCENCLFLPPFSELSHLRELTLRHMPNVMFVEDVTQQAIQDRPFFRALRELTLHNFYKLEGWSNDDTSIQQGQPRSFPPLIKLRIWDCPNLKSLPSFTRVSDLDLHNVNQLLLVDSAKNTAILKNRNCTTSLQIKRCPNLKVFEIVREGLGGLPSLKHLLIEDCNALISLADDVGKISSLEKLEISKCEELDLSHESQIAYTVSHQFLREAMSSSPWRRLKSLRKLTLSEIPKMKTLPTGLKHVQSLETLRISACLSLGSLPEWLSCLTALQQLRIESCHALKRLPDGIKDVKSLMKLEIADCPELIKRCREQKGEDWQKIKHARVLLNKSRRYRHVSHV